MSTSRDPDAWLPLTPALFYVLVALADEEKHGYAIIKDVASLTSDSVRLSSDHSYYGIIKRLLDDGLVVELRRRPEGDVQKRR